MLLNLSSEESEDNEGGGGGGGPVVTNAVTFQKITILVKHCPKCKALVQVFPYDLGKT